MPSEAKVHRLSFALKPPKRWQLLLSLLQPRALLTLCVDCDVQPRRRTANTGGVTLRLICTWLSWDRAERKPECWLLALYRIQMHEFQYRLFLLGLGV